MKPIAMTALLLFCSVVALAQQTHTYIYEYDANATPGSTYKAHIDGVTIPVVQSSVDCPASTTPTTRPPAFRRYWPLQRNTAQT
jgi:hypothetical protein